MSLSNNNNDGGRGHRLLNPDRDDQSTGGGLGDRSSRCPKPWKFAVTVLFVCALFLVGVVVGFYIAQTFEPYRSAQCRHSSYGGGADRGSGVQGDGSSTTGLDPDDGDDDPVKLSKLHESVVDLVPKEKAVLERVTVFTDYQVHSVSDLDLELVNQLQEHFNSCRFDDLSVEHYKTLISLPDRQRPSRLLAFDGITNRTIVDTDFKSLTFAGRLPGFVAYSPNASVEGELVYLNRGTLDDYSDKASTGLKGKIGLVRTGQTTLEEKVHLAECHGLIGLLVVEDSQELHRPLSSGSQLCSDVTPYALFHVIPGGDPSTPSFPSIAGAWRPPLSEVKLPKIPVQTVSCETAKILMNQLDLGTAAGLSEGLDTPAIIVQLEVNNQLLYKPIQNIIATLYGDKDSDFSILVGANRNSFDTGSSGGIPGTEVLMRVSSAVSRLFHKEHDSLWIPRRTIRFVSWGGSDFGYLGLTEFLEKYHDIWRNKLIAYIDLDSPSKGRRQLEGDVGDHIAVTSSTSVEVLINLIMKQLQNRDGSLIPEHIWQSVGRKPSANSHHSADICPATLLRKHLPASYVHLQVSEVSDDAGNAPADSKSNYMLAQIASLLTLTLADSGVFHFQVHRTAHETISDVNKLINNFSGVIPNATIGTFHGQLKRLRKSTMDFEDYIRRHLEFERSEDVRMVNSALLQLEAEMTSIQVEVARIQAQHKKGHGQCVAVTDLCTNSTDQEVQLMTDISALLSRVMAVPKVTDLTG